MTKLGSVLSSSLNGRRCLLASFINIVVTNPLLNCILRNKDKNKRLENARDRTCKLHANCEGFLFFTNKLTLIFGWKTMIFTEFSRHYFILPIYYQNGKNCEIIAIKLSPSIEMETTKSVDLSIIVDCIIFAPIIRPVISRVPNFIES